MSDTMHTTEPSAPQPVPSGSTPVPRLPRPELTYPIMGKLAVDNGFIDKATLKTVMEAYRARTSEGSSFEAVLMAGGGLEAEAITRLFTATIRSLGRQFVKAARSMALLTTEQAEAVLRRQADGYRNGTLTTVADLLVASGELTPDQRENVYARLLHPEIRKAGAPHDRELGNLAVSAGFLSRESLDTALRELHARPEGSPAIALGDYLVAKGHLPPAKLHLLHATLLFTRIRKADEIFCRLAVMRHLILPDQGLKALKRQADGFRAHQRVVPVGHILVKEGVLSESDMRRILREQGRIRNVIEDETPKPVQPVRIALAPNGLSATFLRISQTAVDPASLLSMLKNEGVRHGCIPEAEIRKWAESPDAMELVVAQGTPPTPSVDGRIELFFEPDYLQVGKIQPDGDIDFLDRGEIPFVTAGTELARRIPPVPGIPGIGVTGTPLPPRSPHDVTPTAGEGAILSEDGQTVTADAYGRPRISLGGRVDVIPEIEFDGNIDTRSGHVHFIGHVRIRGRVQPGFRVEAASAEIGEGGRRRNPRGGKPRRQGRDHRRHHPGRRKCDGILCERFRSPRLRGHHRCPGSPQLQGGHQPSLPPSEGDAPCQRGGGQGGA